MYEEIKRSIYSKIKEADTVILCRHIRPDGDALGSTLGFKAMLEASFPCKKIFIERDDENETLGFIGDEGLLPSDGDFKDALVIVLDTSEEKRVSSKRFLTAKTVAVIDHHIKQGDLGDFMLIDDKCNSVCEMITDFWKTFDDELVLTKHAAECLFTGIVTDTGRFKFRGTSARTLRLSAYLLEKGVDYQTIYNNIDIKDYKVISDEAYLMKRIKLTGSGVAYIRITREIFDELNLTGQTASDSVTLMESIKGSLIWLVLIDNDDGSIRARIRSRFVEIEPVARKYNGGGHACASGATLYSEDEAGSLLNDLDSLLNAYKSENPDRF